jgi:hypothetical protein
VRLSWRQLRGTTVLAFVLAAVLLFSCFSKLTGVYAPYGIDEYGVPGFASLLRRHAILPEILALPTAWGVVAAEALVALSLLGARRTFGGYSATLLFAMFTVYLITLKIRNPGEACGCLGEDVARPLWMGVVRNTLLIAASACVGWRAGK